MPRVLHFDIHADNTERAAQFYRKVFGWKIEKWNDPSMDYWLVSTGDEKEPGIDGGLSKRTDLYPNTYNTIGISSVDEFAKSITAQGGKVLMPKNPIPGVGYFALCADTEGNPFGILQPDKNAK